MGTYTSKIRAYREARGLRQEQLADAIGVCRKTISQMEAEEGHNTTLEIAYRLAIFFETTVEEIFPIADANVTSNTLDLCDRPKYNSEQKKRTCVRIKREEEFTIEETHIYEHRSGFRKSKQLNVR